MTKPGTVRCYDGVEYVAVRAAKPSCNGCAFFGVGMAKACEKMPCNNGVYSIKWVKDLSNGDC